MAFCHAEISFIHLGTTPPLIFTPSRVAFSTTRKVRRLRSHRTRERLTPLESSEDLYILYKERAREREGNPSAFRHLPKRTSTPE